MNWREFKDHVKWMWYGTIFLAVVFGLWGYIIYRLVVDFLL